MIPLSYDKKQNEKLDQKIFSYLKKIRNGFSCFSTRGYIFKIANENVLSWLFLNNCKYTRILLT